MPNEAQQAGPREDSVAPLEFLRILRGRKWTVASFALVFAAAGLVLASQKRPRFEASASLLVTSVGISSMLGDLSALAALSGDTPALAEVAVLRSRNVVEETVRGPGGALPPVPETPGYERHVGLATTVTDEGLHPVRLLRRALAGELPRDRPPVFADGRLFAATSHAEPDAPRRVRVEFLAADRMRISTWGILQRLHLADTETVELPFVPGEPVEYRGLTLHFTARGDVTGGSFLVDHVPDYEAEELLRERYWAGETTRGSGIIRVAVSDTDPHRAAETANAICLNYLDEVDLRRERRTSPTLGYIRELLDQSRADLDRATEVLFESYGERPELIALEDAAATLIEGISKLELARTGDELRRRTLTDILARLREGELQALAGLDAAITQGAFVDPVTEGYLVSIGEVNAEYATLAQDLGDEHPSLVQLRGANEELTRRVEERLASRARALQDRVEEQDVEIQRLRGALGELPGHMQGLAEPMLTVEINQELLPALLQSLHTAEIANESTSSKVEFLDRAEPPTEVHSPSLPVVALLGAVLGLVLGSAVAFVSAPARAPVHTESDVASATRAAVLAVVARPRRGDGLPLGPDEDAREAAGLRSLRAALCSAVRTGLEGGALVGVASASDRDERARLALGAAQTLGQSGARTLLVGLDPEAATQREALGCTAAPGLLETLGGEPEGEGWPSAVQETSVPGLRYLALGEGAPHAVDLLAGPAFEAFAREARSAHDFVLFDLPGAGDASSLESVAGALDGIVLVARAGRTRRSDLAELAARVRRAGGTLLGGVLSGAGRTRRA